MKMSAPWTQGHAAVTILVALATLGDATQIEMILIPKASKEGAISLTYSPTNFANVHETLFCRSIGDEDTKFNNVDSRVVQLNERISDLKTWNIAQLNQVKCHLH
jgi:hypothetical protein